MSVYAYTTKKYGRLFGVRYVDLSNGQRKNVRGFKNKREAQAAEFRLIDQSKNVVTAPVVPEEESNDILFSTLFDLYRTTYLVTLAPSKMYDYIKLYEKYIAPTFADSQISSISRKTVTLWQDALPVGLSSKYKRKIRSFLSSVFTFAVQRDYLEKNPVDNVVPIRNTEPKKEMLYWTKEEYDRFISCVGDPTYHALFYFLYNTGCRKGEAFALRWSDLDFANDTVTIRRNLTKKGQMMAAAVLIPSSPLLIGCVIVFPRS